MPISLVMPPTHLILWHSLPLLASIFPNIRDFSKWVICSYHMNKVLKFQLQHPSFQQDSGLIFLEIDWFDLLAVQEAIRSLLQHLSSKVSILQCSAFFMVQLSLSSVVLESKKRKSVTTSTFSPSICHEVMGSEDSILVSENCSVVSDSLWSHVLYSPWNSPGQNTGVGSLSFLQAIFPTQGLNPGLPHCRRILYQLGHKWSQIILEWVAYPFSSGSSRPRNRTRVSCIAGGFFTNWTIMEDKTKTQY